MCLSKQNLKLLSSRLNRSWGAASKQTDTSGIKTIVLHLGTNDVISHDRVDIMLNASRDITNVEKKFPDANIAICSVPARIGSERQHLK